MSSERVLILLSNSEAEITVSSQYLIAASGEAKQCGLSLAMLAGMGYDPDGDITTMLSTVIQIEREILALSKRAEAITAAVRTHRGEAGG